MSCYVDPVRKDQCVLVAYKGEPPFHEMMSTLAVTNRYLAMKHWNRMIVDITRMRSTPTTLELIHLAIDLSSDLPPGARIALVVSPDQVGYGKLVQCVAQIEGVELQIFFEIAKAKAWARETAHDDRPKSPDLAAAKSRC